MIVKESTQNSISEGSIDQHVTELGKNLNIKKSIDNQLELVSHFPIGLDIQTFEEPNAIENKNFSIEENIENLWKVKRNYGFNDNPKYSEKTQTWEGYIIEISQNTFIAKLKDLTTSGTDEIMTFDLDDVSPEDQNLLKLGAIFYFSIGYIMNSGQREKKSFLRFKRIAEWTESEFNTAADRASEMFKKLKWE